MNSIVDLLSENAGFNQPGREYGGFVLGTVTNNSDKNFPGMVKVEFTAWENEKNITEWIPLLRPYAGKDYGAYLVPETGDQVLVGFIGPDLKHPFVLGSFFPDDAAFPKDNFTDKNTVRTLKTVGGIVVALSDEKGKGSLSVTTPDELSILLDDEKKAITLSDQEGKNKLVLDSKSGALQVEIDSKITIKTGSCELVMDGKSGKLSISCGQLEIKASQKSALNGGQMLEIKGGMVKVEGQQNTAIKGAIIQLN